MNFSYQKSFRFGKMCQYIKKNVKYKQGQRDFFLEYTYSVATTYGINSVISKLMAFIENAETGPFLFLIMLILSCFSCS
jgi:hypothetical protein